MTVTCSSAAIASVLALAALGAGCTRSTPAPHASDPAPRIRVSVEGGCPASLGTARDVHNSATGLAHALVPRPAAVDGGLVCQYGLSQPGGPSDQPVLTRRTSLDAARARSLAAAAARIDLGRPGGTYHCPAQLFGAFTIIVLRYQAGPDIDLWYNTSGCQTIDNGEVRGYQAGNPSFYDTFQATYVTATMTR